MCISEMGEIILPLYYYTDFYNRKPNLAGRVVDYDNAPCFFQGIL